jgi:hypothetical protein
VRECADALALNAKASMFDNINTLVEEEVNKVRNLHRVVQISINENASYLRKNCAVATVWYETMKYANQSNSNAKH